MSLYPTSFRILLIILVCFGVQGCHLLTATTPIDPAAGLSREDYIALRKRTEPAQPAPAPTAPPIPVLSQSLAPAIEIKRVSISVSDAVPVRDILLDLSAKAKINMEIDPRIQGNLIFSAYDQPFDEVLKHICASANLRYRQMGNYIRIELDEAYQENYPLNYLSLNRKTSSQVSIATDVFNNSNTGNNGGNNSTAKIDSSSDANLWDEVEKSLTQILGTHSDKEKTTNFTINRQAGLVTVFAKTAQQESVAQYFRTLRRKIDTQVLIEARIIEVSLDDEYKSGINWRTLANNSANGLAARFGDIATGAPFTSATSAAENMFSASVGNKDFSAILNLVKTFGTTRVLSSPRLTVLNNQTAVLKVATNQVYFITSAQFSTTTNTSGVPINSTPIYSSTPHTVPVGFVMTVQPSIDEESGVITMTVRPTISRIVGQVNDPSIGLNASASQIKTPIVSQIPVLAVREMDSVLRLRSGEVAIMGGLMQDSSQNTEIGIPGLDTVSFIDQLTKSRDNESKTSELVILLRATITDNPAADQADATLYHTYNHDPRPLPLATDSTKNQSPQKQEYEKGDTHAEQE